MAKCRRTLITFSSSHDNPFSNLLEKEHCNSHLQNQQNKVSEIFNKKLLSNGQGRKKIRRQISKSNGRKEKR